MAAQFCSNTQIAATHTRSRSIRFAAHHRPINQCHPRPPRRALRQISWTHEAEQTLADLKNNRIRLAEFRIQILCESRTSGPFPLSLRISRSLPMSLERGAVKVLTCASVIKPDFKPFMITYGSISGFLKRKR